MTEATFDCAYLGGHHESAPTQPMVGQLALRDTELRFEVISEYAETFFSLRWTEVTSWSIDGSNAATSTTSSGRVLAGALIAGLPGALIGGLAQRERYNSVLIIDTERDHIGFAIKDLPPVAVDATMRRFPAAAELANRTSPTTSTAAPAPIEWSYLTTGLEQLDQAGREGWEAVSVWVDGGTPKALLKRPTHRHE